MTTTKIQQLPTVVQLADGDRIRLIVPEGYQPELKDGEILLSPIKPVFKSGDVLVYRQDPNDEDYRIVLFKGFGNYSGFDIYCQLTSSGNFTGERSNFGYKDNPLSYADADQRQRLFDAMDQAGMYWDEDAQQLREAFRPKDGDIVVYDIVDGGLFYAICKGKGSVEGSLAYYAAYSSHSEEVWFDGETVYPSKYSLREATEADVMELLAQLRLRGKDWNQEDGCLVDYVWEPALGEEYYTPTCIANLDFVPERHIWEDSEIDNMRMEKSMCFPTKELCERMCARLDEAVAPVLADLKKEEAGA